MQEITYDLRPVENKELDGQVDVYFFWSESVEDTFSKTEVFVCSFYGPVALERAESYIAMKPQ